VSPRSFLVLVAAAALVTALAACSPQASDDPGDGRLRVVATTTQVGSVADEIGGDDIDLTVLLKPGVESHDFELTPEAGAALEQADLVLVSGAGLEDWLEDTLGTIGGADRVRDLSEGVSLRAPGDGGGAQEDDHDDEPVDPHYWLSAPNAVRMVENARDALAEASPDDAGGFTERAAALIERLEAAHAEVRGMIDEIPADGRRIVTDHDALGYFIDEYGLDFVGSVFSSLDVSSEPSAQDIEALVAEIREHGVTAIFTESSVNPRLAAAVAEETDARLVDDPIYTDSLGPEGSGADTLDGMLVHNARVIRDGLLGG
jgi:ABC-type Zn uptake system ZnuABC Zn-binding protein ZnuA